METRPRKRGVQPPHPPDAGAAPRAGDERGGRILDAAVALFAPRGYARTQTLDIATRARVSKRELYRLFEGKDAILAACVERRARQIQMPLSGPPPADRGSLAAALATFGAAALRELSDPAVVA